MKIRHIALKTSVYGEATVTRLGTVCDCGDVDSRLQIHL